MTLEVVCPGCRERVAVRQPDTPDTPIRCPECKAAFVLKIKPPAASKAEPQGAFIQTPGRPSAAPRIAASDPPRKPRRDEDAVDDDRPRKKRRDDDLEDEERPRRRRDPVYEDERPKKRRDEYDDRADSRPRRRRDEDDDRPRRRPDSYDDEGPVPRIRRKKKSGGPLLLILLLAGGGVLALVAVIVIIIVAAGSGQSNTRSFSLQQGTTAFWNINFKQNQKVEIWVSSTGQSDVDLYVFDSQGRQVAFDDGDSKDCYVMFIAKDAQAYRVEVRNMVRVDQQWRNGFNSGTLRFAETVFNGQAPQPPPGNPPLGKDLKPPPQIEFELRPEPNEGPPPEGWKVLFRSDNPALWNTNSPDDGTHFALPVRKAHSQIRFLRLKRMDTGEALILSITHQQLSGAPLSIPRSKSGHCWNGNAGKGQFSGRHLGIFTSPCMLPIQRGQIAIRVDGPGQNHLGSGFGHKCFVDNGQCWAWKGKEIPRTVFEIAVKVDQLTEEEARILLPAVGR